MTNFNIGDIAYFASFVMNDSYLLKCKVLGQDEDDTNYTEVEILENIVGGDPNWGYGKSLHVNGFYASLEDARKHIQLESLRSYDLSNKTHVTIESLKAVGFSYAESTTYAGFSFCDYEGSRGCVHCYFQDGVLEGITVWDLHNTKCEYHVHLEADADKLGKCTVELLLWFVDVFCE